MKIRDINMKLINKLINHFNFPKVYYSQFGEDILINTIFNYHNSGFYIDVGAYHPIKFSNTYKLYQKGWRGINIDAMPGSMSIFKRKRPNDLNLEIPIYDENTKLIYSIYKEQAYNTLDLNIVKKMAAVNLHPIQQIEISTKTLEDLLDQYLPKNVDIDLLTIDAEGVDFKVLRSININKYKPKLVVIEILNVDYLELIDNEIFQFLSNNNYVMYSKIVNSVFFLRNDFYRIRFN